SLNKVGYINMSGDWMVVPNLRHGEDFSEGMASVVTSDDHEAYIDKSGKTVVTITTTDAFALPFEFSEGLAPVVIINKGSGEPQKTENFIH
ncbi:MAG: WG repeat-containing protein, partial [Candidatus Acidiferrales bacterium]